MTNKFTEFQVANKPFRNLDKFCK